MVRKKLIEQIEAISKYGQKMTGEEIRTFLYENNYAYIKNFEKQVLQYAIKNINNDQVNTEALYRIEQLYNQDWIDFIMVIKIGSKVKKEDREEKVRKKIREKRICINIKLEKRTTETILKIIELSKKYKIDQVVVQEKKIDTARPVFIKKRRPHRY